MVGTDFSASVDVVGVHIPGQRLFFGGQPLDEIHAALRVVENFSRSSVNLAALRIVDLVRGNRSRRVRRCGRLGSDC